MSAAREKLALRLENYSLSVTDTIFFLYMLYI